MTTTLLKLFQNRKSERLNKEIKESLLSSNSRKTSVSSISSKDTTDAQNINDPFLIDNGYKPTKLMYNTYYEQLIRVGPRTEEQFIVKKISKRKNILNINSNNNNSLFVETNPINEALLFKNYTQFTGQNKTYSKYICKYIDFFENNNYYYLIMQDENYALLKDWLKKAFHYISTNQLNLKHYRKIIKYLFWQITLLMHWVHNKHLTCHLSINTQNIMIHNGEFIKHTDGSVTIPTNIQIKLCNLSTAKRFAADSDQFAQAAKMDVYQIGTLLYLLTFGQLPNKNIVENNKLYEYIRLKNLSKFITAQNLELMILMFGCDNISIFEIMQCKWLSSYWNKYKIKIGIQIS